MKKKNKSKGLIPQKRQNEAEKYCPVHMGPGGAQPMAIAVHDSGNSTPLSRCAGARAGNAKGGQKMQTVHKMCQDDEDREL